MSSGSWIRSFRVYSILLKTMSKSNRAEPVVLEYSRFNTVYERQEHDKALLQSLDNLAKISRDLVNPLTIPMVLDDNGCEDVAQMAALHRDACRPNSTDLLPQTNIPEELKPSKEDYCQCGCKNIRGGDLPFCIRDEKLKFMGSSIVLNLYYMRVIIGMLLLVLIFYALFDFTTNMVSSDAGEYNNDCNDDIYCIFKIDSSLINKSKDYLFTEIQLWLGFFGCLCWIGVLRYAKYSAKNINQDVDKHTQTPSDLAIKLQNLPFGECDQEQINDMLHKKELQITLEANDDRSQLQIKAIHIVYNMSEVRKMIENIHKQAIELIGLIKHIQNGKLAKDKDDEYRNKKIKLIQSLESLDDYKKRFLNQQLFRRKLATTCAIIQFKSQFGKDHFLKKYGTSHMGVLDQIRVWMKNLCSSETDKISFKGRMLTVERAPEPQDILWQNCQMQYSLTRIVFIWFVTFLIICVSLGIIVGLQVAQQYVAEDPDLAAQANFLGYVISFALMIVNKLIWVVLFWLIKIEYNHSMSDEVISRVNKTVILQSLNCIVLPMISSLVIQAGSRFATRKKPFDGLVMVSGQALDYSISNCLVPVAFLYFDVGYIIKLIVLYIICLRNKVIRYLSVNETKNDQQRKSIKKVNDLYEGGDFDITGTYVYLVANILHASFYCTLQPFILFLATLGTTLFYFMKKYLLLRRYSSPKMLSTLVFNNALVGLSYAPVFYAIGSLVFVSAVHNLAVETVFFVPSCLALGFAFLNILNPGSIFDKITAFLHKKINQKSVKKTADESTMEQIKNTATVGPKNQQKATPTPAQNIYKRNAEYYVHNHISTLIGFKYLLLGKPINEDVRQSVKAFVEIYGEVEEDPYHYPDIKSDQSQQKEARILSNFFDQFDANKQLEKLNEL